MDTKQIEQENLAAVKQEEWIKGVEKPSDELVAVSENEYVRQAMEQAGRDGKISAVVNQDEDRISMIGNPSEELQMAAVKQNLEVKDVEFYRNPNDAVMVAEFDTGATITKSSGMTESDLMASFDAMDEKLGSHDSSSLSIK